MEHNSDFTLADQSKEPLVSIIVVTYNSSRYVVETLESAKKQTYSNIELIVSDDSSQDDTVEICKKWIDENRDRFVEVNLYTSKFNSGLPANLNRAIYNCKGIWIKSIAGDDTLQCECIKYFVDYLSESENKGVRILSSEMNIYKNNIVDECYWYTTNYSKYLFNDYKINAKSQYLLLLRDVFFLGAPSLFFRKDLFLELNGFDESMPYEDWPFYLKITKKGYKIFFFDRVTVNYRVHCNSIYNNYVGFVFNDFFLKDRLVYKVYRKQDLSLFERLNEEWFYFYKKLLIKIGLNKKSTISTFVFTFPQNIYLKKKRLFRFFLEFMIRKKYY